MAHVANAWEMFESDPTEACAEAEAAFDTETLLHEFLETCKSEIRVVEHRLRLKERRDLKLEMCAAARIFEESELGISDDLPDVEGDETEEETDFEE